MKPSGRHQARQHALQALYQMDINDDDAKIVIEQHFQQMNQKKVDAKYFKVLVMGVADHLADLDFLYASYLDRPVEDITPIEHIVLRLAAFELSEQQDVPYRVVINEALELNKAFGTSDGHKFVNGVLDKAAKSLRAKEYGQAK